MAATTRSGRQRADAARSGRGGPGAGAERAACMGPDSQYRLTAVGNRHRRDGSGSGRADGSARERADRVRHARRVGWPGCADALCQHVAVRGGLPAHEHGRALRRRAVAERKPGRLAQPDGAQCDRPCCHVARWPELVAARIFLRCPAGSDLEPDSGRIMGRRTSVPRRAAGGDATGRAPSNRGTPAAGSMNSVARGWGTGSRGRLGWRVAVRATAGLRKVVAGIRNEVAAVQPIPDQADLALRFADRPPRRGAGGLAPAPGRATPAFRNGTLPVRPMTVPRTLKPGPRSAGLGLTGAHRAAKRSGRPCRQPAPGPAPVEENCRWRGRCGAERPARRCMNVTVRRPGGPRDGRWTR